MLGYMLSGQEKRVATIERALEMTPDEHELSHYYLKKEALLGSHATRVTREFKLRTLPKQGGKPMAQIARNHNTTRTKGASNFVSTTDTAFAGHGNAYTEEARIAELNACWSLTWSVTS